MLTNFQGRPQFDLVFLKVIAPERERGKWDLPALEQQGGAPQGALCPHFLHSA